MTIARFLVLLATAGSSLSFAAQPEFGPRICDEPNYVFHATDWQTSDDPASPARYAVTAGWAETSKNPLETSLTVDLVLVADMERPWQTFASTIDRIVEQNKRCEAQGTRFQEPSEWGPYFLNLVAKIRIDYYACLFGRHQGFLGFQDMNVSIRYTTESTGSSSQLVASSAFNKGSLPGNVATLSPIIELFGGPNVWTELKNIEASANNALRQFNGVQFEIKYPFLKLLKDYSPSYPRPFFSVEPFPPENLLLRFPVRVVVPNAQMCEAKLKIQNWFANQKKLRRRSPIIEHMVEPRLPPPEKPPGDTSPPNVK